MNEPVFIAKGTFGHDVDGNANFSYPAGVQEGDMLMLFVWLTFVDPVYALGNINVDNSWSPLIAGYVSSDPGSSSQVGYWRVYTKIATGAEAGAEAVSSSLVNGIKAQVYQFRSPVGFPFIEDMEMAQHYAIAGQPTWPAVDVEDNERTLVALLVNNGDVNAPAGYTKESNNDGSSFMNMYYLEDVSDGDLVTVVDTGPGATIHIALRTQPASRSFIVN